MGKRITNDETILQLLREGKTHQEIADHFRVSRVAIGKRVKKLNPKPDLSHLTSKEQSFVLEMAKGTGHVEAVLSSYDVKDRKSAATMGLDLLKKPEITKSIEALMEYNGLSREYRIKKLRQHVDNVDANVSLKALDMSFKLDSSYPPTKNLNMNADVHIFHPVDLSKYRCDYKPNDVIEGEFSENG